MPPSATQSVPSTAPSKSTTADFQAVLPFSQGSRLTWRPVRGIMNMFAGMAELADALDLGSNVARRAGSNPVTRITIKQRLIAVCSGQPLSGSDRQISCSAVSFQSAPKYQQRHAAASHRGCRSAHRSQASSCPRWSYSLPLLISPYKGNFVFSSGPGYLPLGAI